LRFGPVRHHVLGLKVLLADGTIAKCGGQLVKNVTGFDLMKLYTGSHGTLCVILEVALRLFPAPECELAAMTGAANHTAAFETACNVLALPTRTVCLLLERANPGWLVWARFFGRSESVEEERKLVKQFLREVNPPEGARASESERTFFGASGGTSPALRIDCATNDVERCWEAAQAALADAGGEPCNFTVQPGIGTIDVTLPIWIDVTAQPPSPLALVTALRAATRPFNANVAYRNAPSEALAKFGPFGDDVIGVDLMRDIKRKLDPNGVFARGRFVGGI
jgi:glycolate oxidase FAD binding subunit